MGKKIRLSFTVDEDDYTPELGKYVKNVAKRYGIPIGQLLSRAFYLASIDASRKGIVDRDIRLMSERAEEEKFDDSFTLSREEWREVYSSMYRKRDYDI